MQTTTVEDGPGAPFLPITRWGTPVMHGPSITEFDGCSHWSGTCSTMYAAEGVKPAATQVGVDRSVFVFDCPDDDQVRHVGVVCTSR